MNGKLADLVEMLLETDEKRNIKKSRLNRPRGDERCVTGINFARVGVAPGSPRCYDDSSQLANHPGARSIHLGRFADPTTERHCDDSLSTLLSDPPRMTHRIWQKHIVVITIVVLDSVRNGGNIKSRKTYRTVGNAQKILLIFRHFCLNFHIWMSENNFRQSVSIFGQRARNMDKGDGIF